MNINFANYKFIKKAKNHFKFFLILFLALSIGNIVYFFVSKPFYSSSPNTKIIWVLLNVIICLLISIVIVNQLFRLGVNLNINPLGSRLKQRIILLFSMVTMIPTIIVTIFSAYLFNFNVRAWFDDRITAALDQSVIIANSYIAEHKIGLKSAAISISDDLNHMYYELSHNSSFFNKVLEAQVEMHSLNEAIVFNMDSNSIMAQTNMSFSLAFINIPSHEIERAKRGEAVEIINDPSKIKMLVKLKDYNNIYLLVSKLVDETIVNYIDDTHGIAYEYMKIKEKISSIQIKFLAAFIAFAVLLVIISMIVGILFANQILYPINQLVLATKHVKSGDLSVRVKEGPENDEIGVLSKAFNNMIKELEHKNRDLVIAQRTAAWGDVARRVAHELRNPLTPIQLSTEMLLKKFRPQSQDQESFYRYINTILRHIEEIRRIVTEFTNFARMPNPKFEPCELVGFIKDLVEAKIAVSEDIAYKYQANVDKIDFLCDKTQLSQVLNNLFKNSEESLELSSVRIKIITVAVEQHKDEVLIIVKDNGKGFPTNLIEKITEPYLTTRTKGTGLGLAIVKKIIEDHFGFIEISNLESGGACVRLIFDIKKLTEQINQ